MTFGRCPRGERELGSSIRELARAFEPLLPVYRVLSGFCTMRSFFGGFGAGEAIGLPMAPSWKACNVLRLPHRSRKRGREGGHVYDDSKGPLRRHVAALTGMTAGVLIAGVTARAGFPHRWRAVSAQRSGGADRRDADRMKRAGRLHGPDLRRTHRRSHCVAMQRVRCTMPCCSLLRC